MKKYLWRIGLLLVCGVFVTTHFLRGADFAGHPELDQPKVTEAAAFLKEMISREVDSVADQLSQIKKVMGLLGEEHYATGMLESLILEQASNPMTVPVMRERLLEVHESITFRPVKEADVPVGFPVFTPVHHIEVKEYPVYRLARVEMEGSDNNAFFSLFNHIKRNDIAMTAPVQIDYKPEPGSEEEQSMAFLYGDTGIGVLGSEAGNKEIMVDDIPGHLAVSVGVRGRMNDEAVSQAEEKLRSWLKEKSSEYQAAGPLRKMGYNSPFIPRMMQYFEVQIPVEKVAKSQNTGE